MLHCRAEDFLKKGTMLKPWGAAMIKKKTMSGSMWIKPRRRAFQPCQLRRAAPSRSLAPAGAPKAAGAAAIEIRLKVIDLTWLDLT